MAEKTHWKSLGDTSRYLGKQHFAKDEEKVLTIEKLDEGVVENAQKRTKDNKRVLYFEEDVKPLILNSVNGSTIEAVLGTPYWQEWVGKKVILYVNPSVPNNFDSEHPGAVRIRPYPPRETEVVCEECGKKITAHGSYSVNKIVTMSKAKYGQSLCWDCASAKKEATE